MDRPSGIPRPSSGIPRLSRLPLPASRTSAKPSSTPQVRPTPSTESLRGRTPHISTFGARQTVGRGSNAPQKKPVARPASVLSTTSGNEDDTLGELEGFRTSSRASSRPDVGSVVDDEEDDNDIGFANSGTRKFSHTSSLADRTRESLSMISSPPGGRKSRSSFFGDADDSMGPPSRPASAMSTNSRPGTSSSMYRSNLQARPTTPSFRTSTTTRPSTLRPPSVAATPSRRSASATAPRTPASLGSRLQRPGTSQDMAGLNSPTTSRMSRTPVSGSKTVGRLPKTRPAVGDMFGDRSASPVPKATSSQTIRKPKATPVTAKKISSTDTEVTGDPDRKIGNSSAALREQIRAAKAAKVAAARQEQRKDSPEDDQPTAKSSNNGFDFDFNSTMDDEDPFNQLPKGGEAVIKRRVANARSDGNMNIANMGLEEIPGSVMSMYEFDPNSDFAWGETVDLTKFNAADNKIVALPDDLFPDIDPPTDFDDDEVKGPQFGGLEKLDLHGNLLKQIPLGLRKLGFLTSLNLSRNPLGDECFDTISQIASLKELKLAENNLEGELPSSISHLENLEVLDLHGNKISSLPVSVHALASLRICNLTGNRLESAQLEAFEKTPLVELYLANNKLAGTFFTGEEGFTRLQLLDLSGNSLTAFSDGDVALPALCNLNISQNRISSLPDISTWTSLLSLQAGENKLSELPPGFSTLKSLKHANFDGNDIKNIDPTIGLMEKLETFSIAQNPLGQKKFLSMSTEDLKRSLLARIQPTEDEDATGTETLNGAEDGTAGMVPAANNSIWTVKPNGILDLSSHSLSTLDTSAFTPIATTIRQLLLRQNILTTIPAPLTLATSLTTLDLSSNHLTAALFPSPTHLPHLRTLHLSANRIPSLTPLTTTLTAPNLDLLDLTNNRLTGSLPALRASFPALTTLLAADNGIEIVTADALRGLTAVNLSNNSIGRLEPEIGLLAGAGLKGLEVGGNRFRVPGHAVLCKGSEAVLRWLRDKVPKDESVEEVGDGDDDGGF